MAQAPHESIKLELVEGSSGLYFLFGGINGRLGMPPFEFYRTGGLLNASKVFIRDSAQAWYQRGLPELGSDLASIDAFLLSTIEQSGATRIRFVGNSMGGFAALLFCARLRLGSAIAFAPQAFISPELRAANGDCRWPVEIAALQSSLTGGEILDLPWFISNNHPATEAKIYVSADDHLDRIHADMLADFENISIRTRDTGGHALVRAMRDDGSLVNALRE